jgi:hypothetical protein
VKLVNPKAFLIAEDHNIGVIDRPELTPMTASPGWIPHSW